MVLQFIGSLICLIVNLAVILRILVMAQFQIHRFQLVIMKKSGSMKPICVNQTLF